MTTHDPATLRPWLPATPALRLLEIGCGAAEDAGEWPAAGASEYVGVDLDETAVAQARNRWPGLTFLCVDAARVPGTAVGRFHAVLIRRPDLFARPGNWQQVFAALPALLQPQGRALVTMIGTAETAVARRLRSDPTIWVTTVRPDGRPHSTPVWFYWDGTHIYFGSQEQTHKIRNLAANPHVTLALLDTQDVVIVEGDTEFVDGPEVGRVMAGYAQKYAQAMQAMGMNPSAREGFRLVRVAPSRILAWGMPASSDRVSASQPTAEKAE